MEAITIQELLEAVDGTLLGQADLSRTVSQVDTDSRDIHPGSLFIPLVGERFDGHAYLDAALEAGAAGCLTARPWPERREDRFYIQVADTEKALGDLARWYKDRFQIPCIGVTGSVGKTTAKDMIAAVLGVKYKVLKTEGNFNNNIGLPLTLLRLDASYQAAVLEMGMDKFGEIDYLSGIVQPDIGVITNIGDAHIEKLGSRENIFRAKCELIPHIRAGGLLILKAFTKLYGMAGVRLGYALCADGALLAKLRAAGQPWAVSTPAQAAGLAALKETEYVAAVRALVASERPRLAAGLAALGCRVLPGEANYLLFRCERPLCQPLRRRGILLRSCDNYHGLGPAWYRTAVRTGAENRRLLAALGEVLR